MSTNLTTKRCTKCGHEYPLTTEFWHKHKSKKFGYSGYCKSCAKEYNRNYYVRNSDKIKSATTEWLNNNRDKKRLYSQRSYETHKEARQEYHRQYRESNREKVNRASRKSQIKNPDRVRETWRNRRLRKKNIEGTFTEIQVRELYQKQSGLCFHCGVSLNNVFHRDHWIPITKGGSNWIENIRLLCPHCNHSKQNKLPHEWCPERYPPE